MTKMPKAKNNAMQKLKIAAIGIGFAIALKKVSIKSPVYIKPTNKEAQNP